MEVQDDIDVNLRWHEPFTAIDYAEYMDFLDIDESDGEAENSDFMVNPGLMDFNVVSDWD